MTRIVVAVVTALFVTVLPGLAPAAHAAVACVSGTVNIVAHEDDDLIFLNPDIAHDIASGRCVRTVFVTAGDNGGTAEYWSSRERGMQAAYAVMAGVSDSWTTATVSLTGQPAILRTLTAAPQVSLLFLRLPDGQMTGSGTTAYANQSIAKLASGAIPAISSVDGASSYTHESLVAALASQLTALSPSVVRAQDTTYPDGDNSDHIEAGHLARAADAGYPAPHTLVTYRGYGVGGLAANVGSADLTAKLAA